jgi:hypothetical protein
MALIEDGNAIDRIKQTIGRVRGTELAKMVEILEVRIIGEGERDA